MNQGESNFDEASGCLHVSWKIIIPTIIITAMLIGGGVYAWQKSNQKSEEKKLQSQIENLQNQLEQIQQGQNREQTSVIPNDESAPVEEQTIDETSSWAVYSRLGVNIKYPNDGTYSVETPENNKFTITQKEVTGNRIHVSKIDKENVGECIISGSKSFNGETYKLFKCEGEGNGYGYIIRKDNYYYKFESVWGPVNNVFELMMKTVNFSAKSATLETYRNATYGFEFKYPKDWNYNGEESIVFSPNNIPLRVSVENKISDYYFSVSIDKNWSSSNYNYDAPTKEQVIIDGVKYTAYIFPRGYEVYEPEAGKDYSTFTIPVKKGNLYYIISGQGHANNLANYSEIISSFKFTK